MVVGSGNREGKWKSLAREAPGRGAGFPGFRWRSTRATPDPPAAANSGSADIVAFGNQLLDNGCDHPPLPAMASPSERIAAIRAFNRFYTRRIGVLHEGLLHTRFTLAESRLLWELAHRDTTTASELARELDLDSGYLSRLLRGLKERGLLRATRSKRRRAAGAAGADAGRAQGVPAARPALAAAGERPARHAPGDAAAGAAAGDAHDRAACSAARRRTRRPSCCACTAPATSAG